MTLQSQMSASLSVHSEAKPQGVKALKSGINNNFDNQNTNISVKNLSKCDALLCIDGGDCGAIADQAGRVIKKD